MSLSFAGAALAAVSMLAQDGAAQCTVPEAPAPVRSAPPALPVLPSCVDLAAQKAECEPRVIESYNTTVHAFTTENNAHVARVNAYIGQLRTYQEQVNAYAQCERSANPTHTEAPILLGAPASN